LKTKPLVSICIPNYNNEKFISYSIESALNQSYENIEIIVVDNNSSDKSWSIIKSFDKNPNFKAFKNKSNVGMEKNFEIAYSYSKGIYITFLCSDDLLTRESISTSVQILEKHNNLSFVFGNISFINSKKISTNYNFNTVLNKGEWTHHSLSIPKNLTFLSGTIINQSYTNKIIGELIVPLTFFDWYLWLRLGEYKVGFNNEIVGFHRYHDNNQTKIITPSIKKNYSHLLKVLNNFKKIYSNKKLVETSILNLKFRFVKSILINIGLSESFNFINEIYSEKSHKLIAHIRVLLICLYSFFIRHKKI
jgi:alpha-1,3-rhamnosyltransferase